MLGLLVQQTRYTFSDTNPFRLVVQAYSGSTRQTTLPAAELASM